MEALKGDLVKRAETLKNHDYLINPLNNGLKLQHTSLESITKCMDGVMENYDKLIKIQETFMDEAKSKFLHDDTKFRFCINK